MTFEEATNKLRDATGIILNRENEYKEAVARAADAEAVYRRELGEAFRGYRDGGKAVEESSIRARADVVGCSRERDYAAGMLKLAGEKLENARDTRRSLWRLVEWSRERERRNAVE